MYKLQIRLLDPGSPHKDVTLEWAVNENAVSIFWLKMLVKLCQAKQTLFPRFTGFISPYKDMLSLQKDLNDCIETINQDGRYYIPERAQSFFEQKFANAVHHHFEILRGPADRETEYFIDSPPAVRIAVLGLNHCIHDMEALHRAKEMAAQGAYSAAALVMECVRPPKFQLPAEFYRYFTLSPAFGDVVLHYCHIGKTWWEVFLDQDEDIFNEAIVPLSAMSGEFDIFFNNHPPPETVAKFYQFLIDRGLDPDEPTLALGYLPVARLIRKDGLSNLDYLNLIAGHLCVDHIHILKDDQVIAKVTLDDTKFASGITL